ncbi:histidine kinase N-terminal 7TM domain-containing protein [Natronocalculus amylovorans]|uniref:histidine kinase n=1 Tax=Natronocalculus amylovorans TaxID=2917812 RepID=A0AAE3KC27_9EURY|nr:histidine kinase N-terminal 7TM domain-containing protein [Natronocalculus amylovorans]MCL9817679.1 ATP-binding protein [Natronocalculus amylovorans]
MSWDITPYTFILFIAAVTSFLWAAYGGYVIRKHGRKRYLIAFVIMTLSGTFWAILYAIQLASPTLEGKFLAYRIMHIGSLITPPAWLIFALAYTGRESWLTKKTIAAISFIPFALLVSIPTNPYQLAFTDVYIEFNVAQAVLVTENGPLYLMHLTYSYIIIFIGVILLLIYAVRSPSIVRRQAILLTVGAVVPTVINIIHLLNVPPLGSAVQINLTPISLAFSSVFFGIAIFRYRALDLRPIASEVVISQMGDGVIVIDQNETVVEINPAAKRLFGVDDVAIGSDIQTIIDAYPKLRAATEEDPHLISVANDTGMKLLQLTRSSLSIDTVTVGWVILCRDVTVQEEQRRELAAQNEQLDAFASSISHDLQTPLSVISGYATLAEETGDPTHFETIRKTVTEIETFRDELLALAKQGQTVTDPTPVQLADVVAEAADRIATDSLTIVNHADAVVLADRLRLQQVIDNLLRNARDHSTGPVIVTVRTTATGFVVEDDGPGVPESIRESLFDVGVTTHSGGSGFGLGIVRRIVEAHG